MTKMIIPIVSLFLLLIPHAFANPLLALPSGNISFTLEIHPHRMRPTPPEPTAQDLRNAAEPARAQISRTDKLVYIKETLSNGDVVEYWKPAKMELTVFTERGDIKVRHGKDLLPSIYHLDQALVSGGWISSQSFRGEEVYRGIKCRRYEKTIEFPSPHEAGVAATTIYQAWIDHETLVPVAFDDGDRRYDIVFHGESSPMVPPAAIERELKSYEALLSPAKRR